MSVSPSGREEEIEMSSLSLFPLHLLSPRERIKVRAGLPILPRL
jgi:hypothetical protein